jgi:hypothetical protein
MTNAFEYGDALQPDNGEVVTSPTQTEVSANAPSTTSPAAPNQPYLNKATLVQILVDDALD